MPCSVALEQSGTIYVYTLPSRLSNPNTMVLPDAPQPCFYPVHDEHQNRIHR